MTLSRPPHPRLDPEHPLSRHCAGAWFFGPEKDSATDYSPGHCHVNHGSFPNALYDITPQGPAIRTTAVGYRLVALGGHATISLVGASAAMVSFRAKYSLASNTFAKIIDHTTGANGAGGWSVSLLNYGTYLGFGFYADGSLTVSNIDEILKAPLTETWAHYVVTARLSGTATAYGRGLWVDRVFYDPGNTAPKAVPDVVADLTIANEATRNRPFVGGLEHVLVYRKDTPGSYFDEEDVFRVFDDPYSPFRPRLPLEAMLAAGAPPPPTEFEPHRMFLAGD